MMLLGYFFMDMHRWSFSRSSLLVAAFYAGCSDLGWVHNIEMSSSFFFFSPEKLHLSTSQGMLKELKAESACRKRVPLAL